MLVAGHDPARADELCPGEQEVALVPPEVEALGRSRPESRWSKQLSQGVERELALAEKGNRHETSRPEPARAREPAAVVGIVWLVPVFAGLADLVWRLRSRSVIIAAPSGR
jgi:hypothetical protein